MGLWVTRKGKSGRAACKKCRVVIPKEKPRVWQEQSAKGNYKYHRDQYHVLCYQGVEQMRAFRKSAGEGQYQNLLELQEQEGEGWGGMCARAAARSV